jgi:hypothetical protein
MGNTPGAGDQRSDGEFSFRPVVLGWPAAPCCPVHRYPFLQVCIIETRPSSAMKIEEVTTATPLPQANVVGRSLKLDGRCKNLTTSIRLSAMQALDTEAPGLLRYRGRFTR